MSESVDERVPELVGIAHDVEGETVDEETLEVAREASELVRETDPDRLLEAVDLTGTDGDGPETVPEAIATADSEAVEDLHALLEFAKLADDDGERTDERKRAEEGDEAVEVESQDETESGADSSADAEGDLQAQLRESMQSAFDDFGEDVTGLRDHLEELTDDESADDVEDAEEGKADDPRVDERETDEGDGDTSESPSRSRPRLSTMAPPPSDRPDVRAVSRHSTMPDRRSRR